MRRTAVILAAGSLGGLTAGLGFAQLTYGHSWGYLLLAAGLLVSAPYFIRLGQSRQRPAQRFLCPACGSPFLWAQVGLACRPNRMPRITSIHGILICAACGRHTGYSEFSAFKDN